MNADRIIIYTVSAVGTVFLAWGLSALLYTMQVSL